MFVKGARGHCRHSDDQLQDPVFIYCLGHSVTAPVNGRRRYRYRFFHLMRKPFWLEYQNKFNFHHFTRDIFCLQLSFSVFSEETHSVNVSRDTCSDWQSTHCGLCYNKNSMLKSMSVNGNFPTWPLIAWRHNHLREWPQVLWNVWDRLRGFLTASL